MPFRIDESLYPDVPPPEELRTFSERVDFLARLCSAWDFGLLPDMETVEEIRKPGWRAAVNVCNLLTSPVYHILRRWHNLPGKPYLGRKLAYIVEDPALGEV